MIKIISFNTAFIFSFVFTVIGALLKITHFAISPLASFFIITGIFFTILYTFIGVYEVNNSSKINDSKKIFWTISFIAFGFFTGIFYFINRKKMII